MNVNFVILQCYLNISIYINIYCLMISFLIFLSYLRFFSVLKSQARIVNKYSIKKKKIRNYVVKKNFVNFLQIFYEEKSNVLASRVTFLKQEWKPQKEMKKKWFVRRSRMKQKTKKKRKERRKREEKPMTIEGKKARRKTRTYNALFLVAARFKGKRTLLDISIRDEHATFG